MPVRPKTALIGALASAAMLVLVWLLAFHTAIGTHADQAIFIGFGGLQRHHVNAIASFVATLCDPAPFVIIGTCLVALALARRRPRSALAITVLLIGANVTTQLLKVALAHPRAHSLIGSHITVSPASWPSGHATAAMSLALALVLAVPARTRPVAAAFGAVFAVGVSYSFLTLGWHYPSDVLGGFLIAVIWAQLALAAVFVGDGRPLRRPEAPVRPAVSLRSALTPAVVTLFGAGVLAALIALARPHQFLSYANGHTAFILGAAVIGAAGLALATAVMLSVRR
jgi:membrane-associated phospholipid phosphatase